MLTLYTHPMSRGRTARWMLEELGEPYETRVLDYQSTMKAADYLAINPMGKVPALVHDGHVVTEGAAIVTYLAEAFPRAGLAGSDRAAFLRWMFFCAGPLEQAMVNKVLGVAVQPEQARFVGYGSFETVIATLEDALERNTWLAGSGFSAVDLYAGAQIGYGLSFGTLPDRPALRRYWERMADRPARLRAAALDDALLEKGKDHG